LGNILAIPVVYLRGEVYSPAGSLAPIFHVRLSMKRMIALGLLTATVFTVAPAAPQGEKSQVAKMTLKVGDTAPDFTLLSDGWKSVKLSDYRGKKNVYLAVYVLAFTGG
jgi:predicted amidohydrolase